MIYYDHCDVLVILSAIDTDTGARWQLLTCLGIPPRPRFGHVMVSLTPSPTQSELNRIRGISDPVSVPAFQLEDPKRPGYYAVGPAGFGGPLSPNGSQSKTPIDNGFVFDPPPHVLAELEYQASCRRLLVFGGKSVEVCGVVWWCGGGGVCVCVC